MKKILAIILACTILFGLIGCNSTKPDLQDPSYLPLAMTQGKTSTTYEGVEIQIDSFNWLEGNQKSSLVVVWNNETQYEVNYGASFDIERLDGNEWVSCAIPDDLVFIAIAYLLPAGKMTNEIYTLTDMFDVTSPGTYRFKTDCYVSDNDGQGTKCELTAEFTLGNVNGSTDSKVTGTEIQWAAQYIRTNGYSEGVLYPSVRIIDSLQELKDYYNTWHEVFDLERKEKVYSDTTIGFLDACDKYDAAYFEKGYLVFVLLEEGSGSIRHEVTGSTISSNGELGVYIDTIVPEAGTDDMAEWHIILELDREFAVETENDLRVYLDGQLAYTGDLIVPPSPLPVRKEPPAATLRTPEEELPLPVAGYGWLVETPEGTVATVQDEAGVSLLKNSLNPIYLEAQYAQTVYAPVPEGDGYAPINSLGYLIKLDWEEKPDSVTYVCWPDTVWEQADTQEEFVAAHADFSFYAKPGGYVYAINATWEDKGAGSHGTASYYVYLICGNEQEASQ